LDISEAFFVAPEFCFNIIGLLRRGFKLCSNQIIPKSTPSGAQRGFNNGVVWWFDLLSTKLQLLRRLERRAGTNINRCTVIALKSNLTGLPQQVFVRQKALFVILNEVKNPAFVCPICYVYVRSICCAQDDKQILRA
jgi:hypothetical protein